MVRRTFFCSVLGAALLFTGGTQLPAAAPGPKLPKKAAKAKAGKKKAKRRDILAIPKVTRDKVICFCLYTVSDKILKLTAQLYPLLPGEDRFVRLEIKQGNTWKEIARAPVIEKGWLATFRVENWDDSRDISYRVVHGKSAYYTGTIRKNPLDKKIFTVVAFTGNSIYPQHGGDIPRDDILRNVRKIKPDLLFFSGDQVYDHNRHYAAWLKFGRDFGPIIRDYPTVTIPDDHDVGQANLWGSSGKKSKSPAGDDGGYFKPVSYVNEVQRAQTSHLPDPFDPRPVKRGITVYYTHLRWGGISFAIIEDRKFKTGPAEVLPKMGPRPDHIRKEGFDPKTVDVPAAKLLGERQLAFLRDWITDWREAEMKCVLSQTVFCGAAHLHGSPRYRVDADLDCNGWPQSGRNRALRIIRKAFAFMLSGDQHLATVVHHGIDDWDDGPCSFCVPSIANLYLRWWAPLQEGRNRPPGAPPWLGRFYDPLGNKITMLAVANPGPRENHDRLTTRAAGFGVVRFNKENRTITIECWPREVDVSAPGARQYAGWPITIRQEDNYARKAAAYLPELQVHGMSDPVVEVFDESNGQLLYALRIKGTTWRPKVFHPGTYTVVVGEPGTDRLKKIKHVRSLPPDRRVSLEVDL